MPGGGGNLPIKPSIVAEIDKWETVQSMIELHRDFLAQLLEMIEQDQTEDSQDAEDR